MALGYGYKISICKEYNTSMYLNSPLLKGYELVWKEDGLYHYHKMEKVVLDGSDDEKWIQFNNRLDNTSCFSTKLAKRRRVW